MDAWLREYSRDSRGTSLLLVRSPHVQKVIARRKGIALDLIPVERLVESQRGVISVKRKHLTYRLFLDREKEHKVPKKRVAPGVSKNLFLRREVILKAQMLMFSREKWIEGVHNAKILRNMMQPELKQLARWRLIVKVISLPIITFLYIRSKVRRQSS